MSLGLVLSSIGQEKKDFLPFGFEKGSPFGVLVGLKVTVILLPHPSKHRCYRHEHHIWPKGIKKNTIINTVTEFSWLMQQAPFLPGSPRLASAPEVIPGLDATLLQVTDKQAISGSLKRKSVFWRSPVPQFLWHQAWK